MRPPLRVVVAFDFYNVGDVLTAVSGAYYDRLVDQGYCEPVQIGDVLCAAMDTSDAEKAVMPRPTKRKRGRPRKQVL
jgi:hypothetical protein